MKLLLDTHVIIWSLNNSSMLDDKIKALIQNKDNEVFFSSASVLEISIKNRKSSQKMPITGESLFSYCKEAGYIELPIASKEAYLSAWLKGKDGNVPHEDPFDRILLAQAKLFGLKLITHDSLIKLYDEDCIIFF